MKFAKKMLALLTAVAAALMGFAGSASATTVTSPPGVSYTGHIEASSENGHIVIHFGNGITIECGGFLTGSITSHGAGVTASGPITTMSFPGCTGGDTVTIVAGSAGSIEFHSIGGGNATLTSTGATVTTIDGATSVACGFTTASTHLGVVTGASTSTGHATLDLNSAKITRTHDSILCGTSGTWTGNYKVNTPTGLTFD